MNKVWECIVDVFIGILIMFVSVSIYFGLRTESVIKSMYEGITGEFVTDIKNKGVLTLDDYERYMERMGTGNALFNISFEHRYKIYEPEYRFKTLEEILEEQNNAYKGSNDYHYREVITHRPHVEDPINDGNLNTETNESILANTVNTPGDASHVHDANCYIGHRHAGNPTFTHTHKHGYDCVEFETRRDIYFTCSQCGENGVNVIAAWYWDEATNSVKLSHSMTPYCPYCGSYSLLNISYMSAYNYSCDYNKDIDWDGYTDIVGYKQSYSYISSHPQPREIKTKKAHTSGCYRYHEKGVPNYARYTGSEYIYSLNELFAYGFNAFCEIPTRIEIKFSFGGSDSPVLAFIPEKQADETFLFHCIPSENININEHFPMVNYSTFRSLVTNGEQMRTFLKEHVRQTYIPDSGGSVSINKISGAQSICDESVHNSWYTTCGLEEDGTISCNSIIVSLIPTHATQTIYINDPLITTARAAYKDGSKKTVLCSTSFSTSVIGKNQTVTLEYHYLINGVSYRKTCDIEVTIIPRNKTCPKGHTYNLYDNGSDPGCPYCSEWVESLRIINPTTSPIVITIGTSLQDNNVKLLAAYMDGHTEEVSSGYIDNLDRAYLGTKPVTIGYKGASVTVLVTTKCAIMICDICGYEYNLYPDGTNPGCPRCIQRIPIFTGNIMTYEHINHTEEILNMLYEKKRYIFNVDDVFSIRVTNKSSTIARKVLGRVYPSLTDRWLNIEKHEHVMSK